MMSMAEKGGLGLLAMNMSLYTWRDIASPSLRVAKAWLGLQLPLHQQGHYRRTGVEDKDTLLLFSAAFFFYHPRAKTKQ